ncbi:hypothetical protein AAHC03_024404 [Spirometra sp. Aus1]
MTARDSVPVVKAQICRLAEIAVTRAAGSTLTGGMSSTDSGSGEMEPSKGGTALTQTLLQFIRSLICGAQTGAETHSDSFICRNGKNEV